MKRLEFIPVLLILTLFTVNFTSCANAGSYDGVTDCTFEIDNDFVSSMRSAVSKPISSSSLIRVNVLFSGGYSDSQWREFYLDQLENSTFYFERIPLNTLFDVYVGVYYGSELIYEASQTDVKIINSSSASLEISHLLKKLLNSRYVLYSQEEDALHYSLESVVSKKLGIENDSKVFPGNVPVFCFDNDGYFYTFDSDFNVISDNPKFNSDPVSLKLAVCDTDLPVYLTVDAKSNLFYIFTESNKVRKYPKLISCASVEEAAVYDLPLNNLTVETTANFAVYDDVVFAVCNDASKGKKIIASFNLCDEVMSASAIDLKWFSELAKKDVFPVITDIIFQDDSLYILAKDVSDKGKSVRSRGAVLKYEIASKSTFVLGWSDSSVKIAKKDVYIPGMWIKGFYGPEKFIAIKPGKLVIADDGFSYRKDLTEPYKFRNINRVVNVDLDSFSIASAEMFCSNIHFSNEYTDSVLISE